jgi:rod shape-determining protein MreD
MSAAVTVVIAVLAAVLDISAAPGYDLWGARPSLSVVVVALWSALRPTGEAMLIAPVAGIALGLLGNEPLGVSVLAFVAIVLVGWLRRPSGAERRFAWALIVVAAGTVITTLLQSLALLAGGAAGAFSASGLRLTGANIVLNLALGAVLYFPLVIVSRSATPIDVLRRP